jgi:starvation-inducible outer membrane lipoprotein
MQRSLEIILVCACLAVAAGCAKSAHQTGQDELEELVPADVLSQVDDTVSFGQLRADPHQYVGRTVMFSGVALHARRAKVGTEIEILQVPTDPGMSPSDRKARSEGRFLALQSKGFLDPAVIEKDSALTVVGEVKGVTTKALDGGEYQYPVLEVKQLIDWNDVRARELEGYSSSYDGFDSPYYGHYGNYYGPWSSWYHGFGSPSAAPYPYPYYGPYYFFPRGFSAPAPSPPPAASTPRLFQKD